MSFKSFADPRPPSTTRCVARSRRSASPTVWPQVLRAWSTDWTTSIVQIPDPPPVDILGLLVVGNLAWVGAGIETLRASIAYDLGARHETAQLSQVLGGLLITGAVWAR